MSRRYRADYNGKTFEFDWDGPGDPNPADVEIALSGWKPPALPKPTSGPDPALMKYNPSGEPEPWAADAALKVAQGYQTIASIPAQTIGLLANPGAARVDHTGRVTAQTLGKTLASPFEDMKTSELPAEKWVGQTLTPWVEKGGDLVGDPLNWPMGAAAMGKAALPKAASLIFGSAAAAGAWEGLKQAEQLNEMGASDPEIWGAIMSATADATLAGFIFRGLRSGKPAERVVNEAAREKAKAAPGRGDVIDLGPDQWSWVDPNAPPKKPTPPGDPMGVQYHAQKLLPPPSDGISTTDIGDGWTTKHNPKTGTMSLNGPLGEKVAVRITPERIEMVTIGKGSAENSKSAVDALRALGQRENKPVHFTSTNLSSSGGAFRKRMIERGELVPDPGGVGYILVDPTAPKPGVLVPYDEFGEGRIADRSLDRGWKGDGGPPREPKEGKLIPFRTSLENDIHNQITGLIQSLAGASQKTIGRRAQAFNALMKDLHAQYPNLKNFLDEQTWRYLNAQDKIVGQLSNSELEPLHAARDNEFGPVNPQQDRYDWESEVLLRVREALEKLSPNATGIGSPSDISRSHSVGLKFRGALRRALEDGLSLQEAREILIDLREKEDAHSTESMRFENGAALGTILRTLDGVQEHGSTLGKAPAQADAISKAEFEIAPPPSEGKVLPFKKSSNDDPGFSMMEVRPGKAVGVTQPRLIKELGANLYSGDLGTVIVKEGLQNAVDAIKRGSSGNITVDVDTKGKTFIIKDDGVGMLPDVVKSQFLDPGGTYKPEGGRGGYGIAKVAMFSQAKDIQVESVAKDERGNLVKTTLRGDGDRWLDPTAPMDVITEIVDPSTPTGTTVMLALNDEAKVDPWGTSRWLRTFLADQKLSHNFDIKLDGNKVEPRQEYDSETGKYVTPKQQMVHTEPIPGGTFDVYTSDHLEETSYISAQILNHGLPQFNLDIPLPVSTKMPSAIHIDIKSTLDTTDSNYPFTPNRQQLRDDITKQVTSFVKNNLLMAGIKQRQQLYRQAANNKVKIPGRKDQKTGGRRFILESTQTIGKDTLAIIASMPESRIVDRFVEDCLGACSAIMVHTQDVNYGGRMGPDGLDFRRPEYAEYNSALGYSGGKWYGVNFDATKIFGNIDVTSGRANATLPPGSKQQPWYIVIDPWAISELVPKGIDPADGAATFARELWGTIVHELIHNKQRGHEEGFSSDLTHWLPLTVRAGLRLEKRLAREVRRDPEFIERIQKANAVLKAEFNSKSKGKDVLDSVGVQSKSRDGDGGGDPSSGSEGRLQTGGNERLRGEMRAPRPGMPRRKKYPPKDPNAITPPPPPPKRPEETMGPPRKSENNMEQIRALQEHLSTLEKELATREHRMEKIEKRRVPLTPAAEQALLERHRKSVLPPEVKRKETYEERRRRKEEERGVWKDEPTPTDSPLSSGQGGPRLGMGTGSGKKYKKNEEGSATIELLADIMTLGTWRLGKKAWEGWTKPKPGWQDPAQGRFAHRIKGRDKAFEVRQSNLMSAIPVTAGKQFSDYFMQFMHLGERGVAAALEQTAMARFVENLINRYPGAKNHGKVRHEAERFFSELPAHIYGWLMHTSLPSKLGSARLGFPRPADDAFTLAWRQFHELDPNAVSAAVSGNQEHWRAIGGRAGYAGRLPQRSTGFGQGLAQGMVRGPEKAAWAARIGAKATQTTINPYTNATVSMGLSPLQRAALVKDWVEKPLDQLPPAVAQEIMRVEMERTLVEDLHGISAMVNEFRRRSEFRWAFPFFQIQANWVKQAYQRTPLYGAQILHAIKTGKFEGGRIADEAAKPIFAMVMLLAVGDAIRRGIAKVRGGQIGQGAQLREYNMTEAGEPPYSVDINGSAYPLEMFGPTVGPLIALLADYLEAEEMEEAQKGSLKKEKRIMLRKIWKGVVNNILPSSLSDLHAFLSITTAPTSSDAMGQLERFGASSAAGLVVPRAVAKVANAMDSDEEGRGIQRAVGESDDFWGEVGNYIKRDTPGWRETLPPLRSRTGKVVTDDRPALERGLAPYKRVPKKEDVSLEREFMRLQWLPPSVASNMTVRTSKGPKKFELTEEQKNALFDKNGEAATRAKRMIETPRYQNAPEWKKKEILARIFEVKRRGALGKIRREGRKAPLEEGEE